VALEAEDRARQHGSQRTGSHRTSRHGQQRVPAEVRGQGGRGIGADADEAGVTQADLTGKTDQQVQAQHDDGVDGHANRQIHIKAVGQHQRQEQQDGGDQVQTAVRMFVHG
jgi:hypothetical protein